MAWDFETDPEFQEQLDWIKDFVRDEVEPLDLVIRNVWDVSDPVRNDLIKPLQDEVRRRKLWAANLGPELGGMGLGQVRLAQMNEILGRTVAGPVVFGSQAPDSGNAEILAHFGSPELKSRFLDPLLRNDIVSAYSMTEPAGGSDPTSFATRATRDGDEWVINGEKWFSSHANLADFLIVLAVTDPDAAPHSRASMFVVPSDTPGINILRGVAPWGHPESDATHCYVRYEDVRIPVGNLLGEVGKGFHVAQVRLGGGRVHHAMRAVGVAQKAYDMMVERSVSRASGTGVLSGRQLVQEMIADSWIEIEQYRLLVMRTAWRIDKYQDYSRVRADIAAVKATMPVMLRNVVSRSIQVHGSLGISTEMSLGKWLIESYELGLADGATEVHKLNLARELLKNAVPAPDLFPSQHLLRLRAAAEAKYADRLESNLTVPPLGVVR
ncbi:MAG: acyl-CoA dehydrogenase domain protein [Marmoricola sp.]|nr:acyl-CoA dehydrogenase domain protein [Marmoricola sp.]